MVDSALKDDVVVNGRNGEAQSWHGKRHRGRAKRPSSALIRKNAGFSKLQQAWSDRLREPCR